MKKLLACLLAGVMTVSLASCSGQSSSGSSKGSAAQSSSEITFKDPVRIRVNLGDGVGELAIAEKGGTTEFSGDYPVQSIATTVEKGTVVELETKAGEGYQFLKWTKDGKDFSTDKHITVTVSEDVEYRAHFVLTLGYEGAAVSSIDQAKTFADILALGYHEYGCSETELAYVFELGGTIYRVTADVTKETSDQIFNIDFQDPEKNSKLCALLEPLVIKDVVNLTEMIPDQIALDELYGKTGQELIDDGWTCTGYDLEENRFYMEKAPFRYVFEFEGEAKPNDDGDGDAVIKDLTVESAVYDGLGDALGF